MFKRIILGLLILALLVILVFVMINKKDNLGEENLVVGRPNDDNQVVNDSGGVSASDRAIDRSDEFILIEKISFLEDEQEGGYTEATLYPSGYFLAYGQESGLGYQPMLDNGWHDVNTGSVSDKNAYQQIFTTALCMVKKFPQGIPQREMPHGIERRIWVEIGGERIAFYEDFMSDALYHLSAKILPIGDEEEPKDLLTRRFVVDEDCPE